VIHSTESYQIDVISNDAYFSDQFMNHASKMTAVNFTNNELIRLVMKEVEDDYDVCVMDCSPGRFLLHNNIFRASDLILVPNLPAPLSIYCNNMLMDELQQDGQLAKKTLSFYNMVQAHKPLHKEYLDNRKDASWMLDNFIPFYMDIELIGYTRQSLFHQDKEYKANIHYFNLWREICSRMQWDALSDITGKLIEMPKDLPDDEFPDLQHASGQ
jgi:chromosome partitioning protein